MPHKKPASKSKTTSKLDTFFDAFANMQANGHCTSAGQAVFHNVKWAPAENNWAQFNECASNAITHVLALEEKLPGLIMQIARAACASAQHQCLNKLAPALVKLSCASIVAIETKVPSTLRMLAMAACRGHMDALHAILANLSQLTSEQCLQIENQTPGTIISLVKACCQGEVIGQKYESVATLVSRISACALWEIETTSPESCKKMIQALKAKDDHLSNALINTLVDLSPEQLWIIEENAPGTWISCFKIAVKQADTHLSFAREFKTGIVNDLAGVIDLSVKTVTLMLRALNLKCYDDWLQIERNAPGTLASVLLSVSILNVQDLSAVVRPFLQQLETLSKSQFMDIHAYAFASMFVLPMLRFDSERYPEVLSVLRKLLGQLSTSELLDITARQPEFLNTIIGSALDADLGGDTALRAIYNALNHFSSDDVCAIESVCPGFIKKAATLSSDHSELALPDIVNSVRSYDVLRLCHVETHHPGTIAALLSYTHINPETVDAIIDNLRLVTLSDNGLLEVEERAPGTFSQLIKHIDKSLSSLLREHGSIHDLPEVHVHRYTEFIKKIQSTIMCRDTDVFYQLASNSPGFINATLRSEYVNQLDNSLYIFISFLIADYQPIQLFDIEQHQPYVLADILTFCAHYNPGRRDRLVEVLNGISDLQYLEVERNAPGTLRHLLGAYTSFSDKVHAILNTLTPDLLFDIERCMPCTLSAIMKHVFRKGQGHAPSISKIIALVEVWTKDQWVSIEINAPGTIKRMANLTKLSHDNVPKIALVLANLSMDFIAVEKKKPGTIMAITRFAYSHDLSAIRSIATVLPCHAQANDATWLADWQSIETASPATIHTLLMVAGKSFDQHSVTVDRDVLRSAIVRILTDFTTQQWYAIESHTPTTIKLIVTLAYKHHTASELFAVVQVMTDQFKHQPFSVPELMYIENHAPGTIRWIAKAAAAFRDAALLDFIDASGMLNEAQLQIIEDIAPKTLFHIDDAMSRSSTPCLKHSREVVSALIAAQSAQVITHTSGTRQTADGQDSADTEAMTALGLFAVNDPKVGIRAQP